MNTHYIDCIRDKKEDLEGMLYLRSRGRDNKVRKSLKVKVKMSLWAKHYDKDKHQFRAGMPDYERLNQLITQELKGVQKKIELHTPLTEKKKDMY